MEAVEFRVAQTTLGESLNRPKSGVNDYAAGAKSYQKNKIYVNKKPLLLMNITCLSRCKVAPPIAVVQ